jgi:hypothetical protein
MELFVYLSGGNWRGLRRSVAQPEEGPDSTAAGPCPLILQ